MLASVVGLYGELKNDAETTFDDDKWWGVQGGANIDLFGFKLGGSVGHDEVGETKRDFFTAGIGYGFGPVGTSITYGKIFNTNYDFDEATGFGDEAYNLVFSADYAIAPGLVLAGDVSKFDNDSHGRRHRHRRQGLGRGGQRPPGVLISRIFVRREAAGLCPAALRCAGSLLKSRHTCDARKPQLRRGRLQCVWPSGDKRVHGSAAVLGAGLRCRSVLIRCEDC